VLSQFTSGGPAYRTLAEFNFPKHVYPIGRLDADSEGLLTLSDEPEWNARLLHPGHAHEREYWAQVERIPTPEVLKKLERGILVQGRKTRPCHAWILEPQPEVTGEKSSPGLSATLSMNQNEVGRVTPCAPSGDQDKTFHVHGAQRTARPTIPPRNLPIRFRKSVPTCWIGLELVEGKNRQVRRMTAAIGHPTLRLIRVRIGQFKLGDLPAGQWRVLSAEECKLVLR
jgi:23S rRNA pseudouridine2457 synthase